MKFGPQRPSAVRQKGNTPLEDQSRGGFRVCFVVGIIRHYFSETALVHICIPQTYTPCGGLHREWSYGLSWVNLFGLPLPLSIIIIAHSVLFVKGFLKFFQIFFAPSAIQTLIGVYLAESTQPSLILLQSDFFHPSSMLCLSTTSLANSKSRSHLKSSALLESQ